MIVMIKQERSFIRVKMYLTKTLPTKYNEKFDA